MGVDLVAGTAGAFAGEVVAVVVFAVAVVDGDVVEVPPAREVAALAAAAAAPEAFTPPAADVEFEFESGLEANTLEPFPIPPADAGTALVPKAFKSKFPREAAAAALGGNVRSLGLTPIFACTICATLADVRLAWREAWEDERVVEDRAGVDAAARRGFVGVLIEFEIVIKLLE